MRKTGKQLAYAPNRKSRLFPRENAAPKLIRLTRDAFFQQLGLTLRPVPGTAKKDHGLAGKMFPQPTLTFQHVKRDQRATGNRPLEEFLFGTDIHKKSVAVAEQGHGILRGQCFQHQKNRLLKSGTVRLTGQTHISRRNGPHGVPYHSQRRKVHPPFQPYSSRCTPGQGIRADALPPLTSGVRQSASVLWSAGPSARFPAISPASFCR